MDGDRPLSLGDVVAENPAVLEGGDLLAFYETAMRAQAGADFAYYPPRSVVGRLRAGTVRAGDIWAAESWVNDLVVVDVEGADVAPELADRMRARGIDPQVRSTYRIATPDYVARYESARRLGRIGRPRSLGLLRDALVAHARKHGFVRDT
jgi:2',3'-cyclic-nucleotide 2'-phosphodiesterase (5'-nucleotidase family)